MTKRGNAEGSIYQRASDGKWCGSVSLPGAKRRVLYGRTRQEVARKLTAAMRDVDQGLPIPYDRQTVGQYLEDWLENTVRATRRASTHANYSSLVRLYIAPRLGRISLAKLSGQDVQRLLKEKLDSGLSPRTVAYIRAVLRAALTQAVKWNLVIRNVASLTDMPKARRPEVTPLTLEQTRAFLLATKGDRLEAFYALAVSQGLRPGELLALRWRDVDWDGSVLNIRGSLQRVGKNWSVEEPKTERSRRSLPISDWEADLLRAHRANQIEERLAAPTWQDHDFVFASTVGTPLDGPNVAHAFQRILKRGGLPRVRLYDLRHTCASLHLLDNRHPRVVMELLGHSQIALTMDTYSHVMPSAKRDASDRMTALLAAAV